MSLFTENLGTIIAGIIIIAIVSAVIIGMLTDERSGKSSCKNDCAKSAHTTVKR